MLIANPIKPTHNPATQEIRARMLCFPFFEDDAQLARYRTIQPPIRPKYRSDSNTRPSDGYHQRELTAGNLRNSRGFFRFCWWCGRFWTE